jgi:hypothetical protein
LRVGIGLVVAVAGRLTHALSLPGSGARSWAVGAKVSTVSVI